MMIALYILAIWLAACIIFAPVLIPWLARRFHQHNSWARRSRRGM